MGSDSNEGERMTRLHQVLALSSAALMACGGSDGNSDPDSGLADATSSEADAMVDPPDAMPPLTGLDALCEPGDGPYAKIFEKLGTCVNEVTFITRLLGDGLLGGTHLSTLCDDQFRSFVDDGTVTVDESKFQACIDYVAATECLELSLEQLAASPCGEVFVGTVAIDGDCDIDEQCSGDAYCAPGDGCGSCTARAVNGIDCSADAQCQSQNCNASGVCADPVGLDGACDDDADCFNTLNCVDDICRPPFQLQGETCQDDGDCGFPFSGTYCAFPTVAALGVQNGTCMALPGPGDDCLPYDDVPGGYLCDLTTYAWCDLFTLECQAPTISAADGPCHAFPTYGAGARKCEEGLMCTDPFGVFEGQIGTCIAPGLPGASCELAEVEGGPTSTCHPMLECNDTSLECESNSDYSGECPVP